MPKHNSFKAAASGGTLALARALLKKVQCNVMRQLLINMPSMKKKSNLHNRVDLRSVGFKIAPIPFISVLRNVLRSQRGDAQTGNIIGLEALHISTLMKNRE